MLLMHEAEQRKHRLGKMRPNIAAKRQLRRNNDEGRERIRRIATPQRAVACQRTLYVRRSAFIIPVQKQQHGMKC